MSGRRRPPRSLQAKALQLLAQREQSRVELRRKLMAHARAADKAEIDRARVLSLDWDREEALYRERGEASSASAELLSVEVRVEEVMVWLEAHHFSSDERFAESRIHARQGRFGNLRIRRELATHAINLSAEAAQQLAASELQRALDVCERKFTFAPSDSTQSARQGRFLIARGFSADVARQVLRARAKQARAEIDAEVHADPVDA